MKTTLCPQCGGNFQRGLHDEHYVCWGCGSVLLPRVAYGVRDGGACAVQGVFENGAEGFNSAHAGGGVCIAQGAKGVGDAVKTFRTCVKALSDILNGNGGRVLGGHLASEPQTAEGAR
jgi:hypothetical protein